MIQEIVRDAFVTAARPPAGSLHESFESEEASALLEADFADKADWRDLDAPFLDQAPAGFGSALSFFSPAALRYFLPAYLIADLGGLLMVVDPTFHLVHGFTDATRDQPVNPRRYADLSWFEAKRARFEQFTRIEAAAVVAYLGHRADTDEFNTTDIDEAITNYWQLGRG